MQHFPVEVEVPVDDKAAIEHLRKLGYTEESNLSPSKLCQLPNSPIGLSAPNKVAVDLQPVRFLSPFTFCLYLTMKIIKLGGETFLTKL